MSEPVDPPDAVNPPISFAVPISREEWEQDAEPGQTYEDYLRDVGRNFVVCTHHYDDKLFRTTKREQHQREHIEIRSPMTLAQRIVLVLYCLLVVYCCVWVPWHVRLPEVGEVQLGSRWLWTVDSGGPDISAIGLRLLAATALGVAAFLMAGKRKS